MTLSIDAITRNLQNSGYSPEAITNILRGVKAGKKWAKVFTELEHSFNAKELSPELSGATNFDYASIDGDNKNDALLEACEIVARVLIKITSADRPGLAADQLAWICGMYINQGISSVELAKKWKVSKQAFSRGAWNISECLNLKPARAMRNEIARLAMSNAKGKNVNGN